MEKQKYHIGIRILHWLMAGIIIGLIGLGWYMADYAKDSPNRMDFYNLHKSFGTLILILVVVRIATRIATKEPKLPKGIPNIIKIFARGVQYTIYMFMIAVPLFGYGMSDSAGYGVKMFGIAMPKIFETNKEVGAFFHEYHKIFAYALLALVVLHIAGAIKHKFFDKKENDVLPSML